MNIQIKNQNIFRRVFKNLHDKSEDFLFTLIQRLPERFIPASLMNWMERYTNKRIAELQRQLVKDNWANVELQKAVKQIRQQDQTTEKQHPRTFPECYILPI